MFCSKKQLNDIKKQIESLSAAINMLSFRVENPPKFKASEEVFDSKSGRRYRIKDSWITRDSNGIYSSWRYSGIDLDNGEESFLLKEEHLLKI